MKNIGPNIVIKIDVAACLFGIAAILKILM